MRERARVAALAQIRRIQSAELELARAGQARAEAEEAQALSEKVNAETEARSALTSWEGSLDGPIFDPDHARRLSALLMTREDALSHARNGLDSARDRTRSARTAHAQRAAAVEQTDEMLTQLRRRLARRSDEAAMSALEDRVTLIWTAP